MSVVIINAGSNIGDRKLNLSRAMIEINRAFGDFEMSHTVTSEPWGFDSSHKFLNICFLVNTDLEPESVLDVLQDIEKRISPESHRTPEGGYADRKLDLDIVAIDEKVIDTERLKVPHPHLAERRFFLEPLAEIAPGWRHPATGLSAGDMLAKLPPEEKGAAE